MTKRPLYSDGNEYERQSPSEEDSTWPDTIHAHELTLGFPISETSPDEIRRQTALQLVCGMFRFTDTSVRQLLMNDMIRAAKLFERYLEDG